MVATGDAPARRFRRAVGLERVASRRAILRSTDGAGTPRDGKPTRFELRPGLPAREAAVRVIAAVLHERHSFDDAVAKEFARERARRRAIARSRA